MRCRLGRWAVAAVLLASSCGVDDGPDGASPAPGDARTELGGPDLVSARDTLPPAPAGATSLTVLLTHAGGPADPGLDAAAAALAERPDIAVVVAVAGAVAGPATTMSGFPVTTVAGAATDVVGAAVAATGVVPELVVVGIDEVSQVGGTEPVAAAAVDAGIPALVVEAEAGDQVDHAAAAMQLLDVLDLELDALLDRPAAAHRLTVPSCRAGMLRGRLEVRPSEPAAALVASDCTSSDRTVPGDEAAAIGAGYASLSRLP